MIIRFDIKPGFGISNASNTIWQFVGKVGGLDEVAATGVLFGAIDGLEPYASIYKYDGKQEEANGADFALAIEFETNCWRTYLVQAKRMYLNGSYKYLNDEWNKAEKDKRTRQIDLLINEAMQKRLVPIFALYNNDKLGDEEGFQMKCIRVVRKFDPVPWVTGCSPLGVTIIGAGRLRQFLENKNTLARDYVPESYPLECVLCPECKQASKDRELLGGLDVELVDLPTDPPDWVVSLLDTGTVENRPYSAPVYAAFPLSGEPMVGVLVMTDT